ncbi:MAG: sulfatase-like hydrolase/transferase [Candidatus Diapherotrites archaeon]|nr:sulfatase-like hydrolase/transferase [Candidatus Diapherotrites archaeon]
MFGLRKKKKKNIIIILVDGARVDRAKRFEKFRNILSKGSFFSNMATYAPYTISSVHAVMSGMYGSKNGVDSYYSYFNFRKDRCKSLAEYLHCEGYYTKADAISKLILQREGWDELLVHDEHRDNLLERHKALLNEMKQKTGEGKNFLLYLHYSNIHTALVGNVIKKFDDFSSEYFGNREKYAGQYDGHFSKAEEYLLGVFAEIEALKLLENSIIVVFSDHGAGICDRPGEKVYGSFCYDYTIRAFASFIGEGFPQKEFAQQTRLIDIMPTILETIGIGEDNNYERMQGKSLFPVIDGKESGPRAAFSETGGLGGPWPSPKKPNVHSLSLGGWKLIVNDTPGTKELYNLKEDPEEKNNLIEKMPEKAVELLKEMEAARA